MKNFGTNKFGDKKFYKIWQFYEQTRPTYKFLSLVIGAFITFLSLSGIYRYRKVRNYKILIKK